VCHSHTHYFDKPDEWKKKYLGSIWDTPVPHVINHVETVLRYGAIEVTKEDTQAIAYKGYSWFLLILIARYTPAFCRQWNDKLWTQTVSRIWLRHDQLGPVKVRFEDLWCMIQGDPLYEWLLAFGIFPIRWRNEYTRDEWMYLTLKLLSFDTENKILTSPDLEKGLAQGTKVYKFLPALYSLFEDGTFTSTILDARLALYKKHIDGVNVSSFRDELLAVAWEPSRVVEWCADFEGELKDEGRRCVKRKVPHVASS
jgi:hypothetical protein